MSNTIAHNTGFGQWDTLNKYRAMFELFCKQVGPVPVGVAARSSLLALSMGEKLLRMHMTGEENVQRPKMIAESLNKAFYHHGYPISRREAKDIGLTITFPDKTVEKLMWAVWLDIEKDLEIRKPFDPGHVLMESEQADSLLRPVPQLNLPPDAPDDILQQVYGQLIQEGVLEISPVEFEYTTAVMESSRQASRYGVKGKILACRTLGLDIRTSIIPIQTGWIGVKLPPKK